jgi:hypothetical protein
MLQNVKKALANSEPSTHGTSASADFAQQMARIAQQVADPSAVGNRLSGVMAVLEGILIAVRCSRPWRTPVHATTPLAVDGR